MRFVPRTPRDDVNVSPQHPLSEALTLLAGLTVVFALVCALVLFFVDFVIALVPPATEVRVLSAWTPEGLVPPAAESEDEEQAEALLARLAARAPATGYSFRLRLSSDHEPNAMALPGGVIVLTRGLLAQVRSENELAFVLAHELGHFQHRDHLRQLGRGVALGLLFTAAGIGGNQLEARWGASIADLTARGFSRRQERRADRFALELVQAEYGHVAGALKFLERLRDDDSGRGHLAYLSTHPAPAKRVEELEAYARSHGWALEGPIQPWPE